MFDVEVVNLYSSYVVSVVDVKVFNLSRSPNICDIGICFIDGLKKVNSVIDRLGIA